MMKNIKDRMRSKLLWPAPHFIKWKVGISNEY